MSSTYERRPIETLPSCRHGALLIIFDQNVLAFRVMKLFQLVFTSTRALRAHKRTIVNRGLHFRLLNTYENFAV